MMTWAMNGGQASRREKGESAVRPEKEDEESGARKSKKQRKFPTACDEPEEVQEPKSREERKLLATFNSMLKAEEKKVQKERARSARSSEGRKGAADGETQSGKEMSSNDLPTKNEEEEGKLVSEPQVPS
eukprot:764506-Hanusia_phi.AAC.6